ncbi:Soluble secreted antigen MPT53 precursor [Planctomycetes bacterium Pla163]|uniref:Soluble secreted antigen MPT53 n=1 Tax=Rohdeia mirabilis TaxID=2528008 RepID=A0A518D3T6_9BACT|nr:Soluble secreted antigen MPT53 precursor [Planctomycetes bacterium Pla163]
MFRSIITATALVIGLAACASTPTGDAATVPTHLDVRADWTLVDQRGTVHPTGEYLAAGEPVVLVFWQTWCGSCVAEAPRVQDVHKSRPNLHVFGVVSGSERDVDAADVQATALRLGLTYPQVLDRDLSLTSALAIQGTPTVVVLGADGTVLYHAHQLPDDWTALGG